MLAATLIFIVIAFVVYISMYAIYGIPQKDDQLVEWFATLLELPSNAPFIVVRKLWRREFLQFSRYKDRSGNLGLIMSFPILNWSSKYRNDLLNLLDKEDADYEINSQDGVEFIDAKYGQDILKAQSVSQSILLETFGFHPDHRFRVNLKQ